MIGAREQHGFTLVETLVAMSISFIVLGSVVLVFTVFLQDNRYDQFRDDAQAHAQTMIDRLSRELRSAASTSAGSAGLLEKAAPYDLVFETVNAAPGQPPSGNPTNQMRVRYCLDSNNTLWRQTESLQTTADAIPDTSTCPDTSNVTGTVWATKYAELNDVTNEIGGDTTRPLFTYGPSGWTSTAQIKQVQLGLYVDRNPGHLPGPTVLTSGIYLRNELAQPVAQFTPSKSPVSQGVLDLRLDASPSFDPNGQALSYQWYSGGGCASAIAGATTQQYDAGNFSTGTSQTFSLLVTDTGGLTNCQTQNITIQ
jgi:type II secretory pathway pseudopilin PulG